MTRELIEVDVGPQYMAMSRPVEDSKRLADEHLTVELMQEADLTDCARILYQSFPDWWWGQFELKTGQPSDDVRYARLGLRLAALLHHPDLVGVVARVRGTVAGFAGWTKPRLGTTEPALKSIPTLSPAFMPNHFRKDVLDEILPPAMGLNPEKWAEVWTGIDLELWKSKFAEYDAERMSYVGTRPHWFLAPFVVDERYRGCGVGGALMRWACDRADAGSLDVSPAYQENSMGQPTCVFLDAFPNARPVYMRYGFKAVPGAEISMIREPRMGSI